jgi:uncharacterized protein involved in type VI secretion and phage assembly
MNELTSEPRNGIKQYLGKYRGTVVNNIDPLNKGRLQIIVPDVSLMPTTWAMPCVPVGGLQMGAVSIPPIGAGVWVEFEQGDPDYPIWVGCWWGSAAELPVLSQQVQPPVQGLTFETSLKNGIQVSDLPGPSGGILIKTTLGATITVNDTGIIIQNGKGASISMVGPTVNINNGALVIT